jgi:3',5'-cyclic AMP phosphodiesterase CpdA
MKNILVLNVFKICAFLLLSAAILSSCQKKVKQSSETDNFSFAFMTDIHLQPEKNAEAGFRAAIDTVNKINPDFVITGGDLIMDALGQTYGRADSLYNIYMELIKAFKMPVYNTIGNHEIFGIYDKSGVPKDHPEYGKAMYENRLADRYYSFDHKGWHFMILDGIQDTKKSRYIGMVDEEQMDWIREELAGLDTSTPIVLSTHIPLLSIFTQYYYGNTVPHDSSTMICNGKEVLDLFAGHNLKLVLQGHLHTVEDIYVDGVHFVTGGAVSARWWSGANRGYEEGFLMVHVDGEDFDWEYVDYLWEVEVPR